MSKRKPKKEAQLFDEKWPWPEKKLLEVSKEIEKGKVLTEEEFLTRFARFISPTT